MVIPLEDPCLEDVAYDRVGDVDEYDLDVDEYDLDDVEPDEERDEERPPEVLPREEEPPLPPPVRNVMPPTGLPARAGSKGMKPHSDDRDCDPLQSSSAVTA
ncbi:MAG: hypothetical protein RDV48_26490 [Candidatus Eremiobacteraeota bacterium]|nr:hypothetical protein [Candidatus Eremiobacteraeota bacterium]